MAWITYQNEAMALLWTFPNLQTRQRLKFRITAEFDSWQTHEDDKRFVPPKFRVFGIPAVLVCLNDDMTNLPRTQSLCVLCCVLVCTVALAASQPANPEHVEQLKKTLQCPGCDLREAELGGVQLQNAQLQNADLSGASLYGTDLRGADLTGAILNDADLEMADLTGAIGATLGAAKTDDRTKCPDGTAGPCQ